MNNLTITRYTFNPYFSGYFENGKWYDVNGKELQVKNYNGRNCVRCNRKIYGINKLRSFAKKVEVKINNLPF